MTSAPPKTALPWKSSKKLKVDRYKRAKNGIDALRHAQTDYAANQIESGLVFQVSGWELA
jgi:hypothetical protein